MERELIQFVLRLAVEKGIPLALRAAKRFKQAKTLDDVITAMEEVESWSYADYVKAGEQKANEIKP